jgi:outer membrane immunogenic protein
MKKYLLSGVALLALASVAQAADLGARVYNKAPVPVAPIYNWTGFYIGGHIGGAWTSGNDNFGFATSDNGGFMGGVQAGLDYQFAPNWVLGIEGQWSWTDVNRSGGLLAPVVSVTDKIDGIGSVTGRIGYTWGPGLLYFKGGWAWADRNFTVAVAGVPVLAGNNGNNDSGYTLGGGLEWLFSPNWSGKIEYQYYNFGSNNVLVTPTVLLGGDSNVQSIKAGLNYRFNWVR